MTSVAAGPESAAQGGDAHEVPPWPAHAHRLTNKYGIKSCPKRRAGRALNKYDRLRLQAFLLACPYGNEPEKPPGFCTCHRVHHLNDYSRMCQGMLRMSALVRNDVKRFSIIATRVVPPEQLWNNCSEVVKRDGKPEKRRERRDEIDLLHSTV